MSNAFTVASSVLAIASRCQIGLVTKGEIAPLLGFIIVEGVAVLVRTALVKAVKGSSIVPKAREGGNIEVPESAI